MSEQTGDGAIDVRFAYRTRAIIIVMIILVLALSRVGSVRLVRAEYGAGLWL